MELEHSSLDNKLNLFFRAKDDLFLGDTVFMGTKNDLNPVRELGMGDTREHYAFLVESSSLALSSHFFIVSIHRCSAESEVYEGETMIKQWELSYPIFVCRDERPPRRGPTSKAVELCCVGTHCGHTGHTPRSLFCPPTGVDWGSERPLTFQGTAVVFEATLMESKAKQIQRTRFLCLASDHCPKAYPPFQAHILFHGISTSSNHFPLPFPPFPDAAVQRKCASFKSELWPEDSGRGSRWHTLCSPGRVGDGWMFVSSFR